MKTTPTSPGALAVKIFNLLGIGQGMRDTYGDELIRLLLAALPAPDGMKRFTPEQIQRATDAYNNACCGANAMEYEQQDCMEIALQAALPAERGQSGWMIECTPFPKPLWYTGGLYKHQEPYATTSKTEAEYLRRKGFWGKKNFTAYFTDDPCKGAVYLTKEAAEQVLAELHEAGELHGKDCYRVTEHEWTPPAERAQEPEECECTDGYQCFLCRLRIAEGNAADMLKRANDLEAERAQAAEPVAWTRAEVIAAVGDAMQDAWNDFCADAGHCPPDFAFTKRGRNPEIEFLASTWARTVGEWTFNALQKLPPHTPPLSPQRRSR